jgi:hypothetical protein
VVGYPEVIQKRASRKYRTPDATASDATTRTLAFSAQSSKILRTRTAGCAMKIPFSPRELAGCYEVRQVLGQGGIDLVCRADETVVRRFDLRG